MEVFSLKSAVSVPFPTPDDVHEHQLVLLDAVQEVLEVTENEVDPAGAATFWLSGATLRVE